MWYFLTYQFVDDNSAKTEASLMDEDIPLVDFPPLEETGDSELCIAVTCEPVKNTFRSTIIGNFSEDRDTTISAELK